MNEAVGLLSLIEQRAGECSLAERVKWDAVRADVAAALAAMDNALAWIADYVPADVAGREIEAHDLKAARDALAGGAK